MTQSRTRDTLASEVDDLVDISVIMPVRDVEHWISTALDSVLSQEGVSLEVLVMDDHSTDQTAAIVREYALSDVRVRLVPTEKSGAGPARNEGIARARGRYLAFADGDDVVLPDAYRRLMSCVTNSGSPMVIADHEVHDGSGVRLRSESLPILSELRHSVTVDDVPEVLRDRVAWNRIIERKAWMSLGLYFNDSLRSNDIAAMTSATCALPFDILPEPVYRYHRAVRPDSTTSMRRSTSAVAAHVAQERECLDVISRSCASSTTALWFEGLVRYDLWDHVADLLHSTGSDDADREAVLEALSSLLRAAPAGVLARVADARGVIMSLVAHRHFAEASLLAVRLDASAVAERREVDDLVHAARTVMSSMPVSLEVEARRMLGELARTTASAPLRAELDARQRVETKPARGRLRGILVAVYRRLPEPARRAALSLWKRMSG